MAIDANAYSPKQFTFLIAEQDDFGTFNLNSTDGTARVTELAQ